MRSINDSEWLDSRCKVRSDRSRQERLQLREPMSPMLDASKFANQLSDLAITFINKVEREGDQVIRHSTVSTDTGVILRQLTETYNLIRFINADDVRDNSFGYKLSFSFVILPLVRTMIDGLYNCTALLDDHSRARQFRISGYFRLRESLRAEEDRYTGQEIWQEYLTLLRQSLIIGMLEDDITDADLDNKKNKWPLLADYLAKEPDTPHKQILRKMTLGFWKEYSSISHASYDGLTNIFPFIARDKVVHEKRVALDEAAERHIATHIGRAAGVLLCLLTEIQCFYHFEGANIVPRLDELWSAMLLLREVRELYEFRYKNLLISF
jgi:hypothetical protein